MQQSILSTLLLPLALFIIMFGLGLSLTVADFKRVLQQPRAVLVGAIMQLVLLPALGFAIAWLMLRDSPALAAGLVLLSLCPGGTTANLITHLGRGDTALCITLTAVSSSIKIFTIPLFMNIALALFMGTESDVRLDPVKSIGQMLVIVVVPALMGMLVRSRAATLAARAERPVKLASALFLLLVIASAIYQERANLLQYLVQAGPAALVLNLAGMGLGYLVPLVLRLPLRQRITISIETSIQNGTLAITIATLLLNNTVMTIPAAVYSLVMFVTVGIFVALLNQRYKTELAQQPV